MSQLELSNVVARSLLGAPELLIQHDEKGMFLQWDTLEIELSTGIVTFKNARTILATMSLLSGPLDRNNTITFSGFEGRLRIKVS
jgi:hypothetical protein